MGSLFAQLFLFLFRWLFGISTPPAAKPDKTRRTKWDKIYKLPTEPPAASFPGPYLEIPPEPCSCLFCKRKQWESEVAGWAINSSIPLAKRLALLPSLQHYGWQTPPKPCSCMLCVKEKPKQETPSIPTTEHRLRIPRPQRGFIKPIYIARSRGFGDIFRS